MKNQKYLRLSIIINCLQLLGIVYLVINSSKYKQDAHIGNDPIAPVVNNPSSEVRVDESLVENNSEKETDELKIEKRISELPEYKEANHFIDSISQGQRGLSMMIEKPEKRENDYTVTIGYNGEMRFETYQIFYVNPKTLAVKVYDDRSGQRMSIEAKRNQIGD